MKFLSGLKDFFVTLLIAVVIAAVLKFFIVDSCKLLSESMASTLNTGDRIIVFKLAYHFGDPERGDIIIFRNPDNEEVLYIKRLIGMPGETVEIRDGSAEYTGKLCVIGSELKEAAIAELFGI